MYFLENLDDLLTYMDQINNKINISEHKLLLGSMINEARQYKMISTYTIDGLRDVLSFIDKIDNLGSEELFENFTELKKKINSSDNIQSEILHILTVAEDVVKSEIIKEMVSNISDKLMLEINNNLATNDNVFISIYQQIFTETAMIIKKYNIEQIRELQDLNNENLLQSINNINERMIINVNEDVFMCQAEMSLEKENQLKSNLTKKYPNVGKSNLSILKNLKKIDKIYIKHIQNKIILQVNEYLKINLSNYSCIGDLINDMILFMSLLFRNGFKDDYEDFVDNYLDDLFNSIAERKQSSNKNIISNTDKQNEKTEAISINTKKNCPNKINDFLNKALASLDTNDKEKREIRSYILRIYLNRKSIRIKDMIYNFPISKDMFTDDFISQATELGISLENGDIKKTEIMPETQYKPPIDTIEYTDNQSVEVEDEIKLEVEKKILSYIDNPKSFDGNAFIKLMQLAGYQTNNKNYVAKCFNKLYKDTQIKQSFLEELKRNIFSQEKITRKKQSYRKINIYQKKGHRILFLNDNKTIDGIYNHDDYENRVSNFLGN